MCLLDFFRGMEGGLEREFCLKQENNMWGALSGAIEFSCIVLRGFGGLQWKKWGGNRKKSFYSEMWGPCLRWACENPVGLYVWQSYRNCWIHLVNIWWMFDWILSQNCRNTPPLHTVDQIASSAKNGRLLWLEGMKCAKIPTHCKAEHLIA